MKNKNLRAMMSVGIGLIIYLICSLTYLNAHDNYIEAFKMLTSVIGAGCYWIGSNDKN